MMEEDDSMDNWRQFQGTELGSLLGSIYGNPAKTKINYPKPKLRADADAMKKGFIPGGAKLDAIDPRKATRRSVSIAVPKVNGRTGNDENLRPIDVIPKRKAIGAIQSELDDIRMRQEHYRPAFIKPVSEDREKDRLAQIFTFKGGKGLPEELTMPVGETPLEAAQRRKEQERLDNIRQKRGLMVVRSNSGRAAKALSEDEQFAQQIQQEIEERTRHLQEMREIGIKPQQERALMREVETRVEELKRLNI